MAARIMAARIMAALMVVALTAAPRLSEDYMLLHTAHMVIALMATALTVHMAMVIIKNTGTLKAGEAKTRLQAPAQTLTRIGQESGRIVFKGGTRV